MAFHPSPTQTPPPRDRDARAFIPDADACVDELMALAEWLRDRRTRRGADDPDRDADS